jgi:phospholipid/cholesterol/gamma-HCH transport system permease protein
MAHERGVVCDEQRMSECSIERLEAMLGDILCPQRCCTGRSHASGVAMRRASSQASPAALAFEDGDDRLVLEGVLDISTLDQARDAFARWFKQRKSHVLDLHKLDGLDTPGALFLCELAGKRVELTGVRAEHKQLLDLIGSLKNKPLLKARAIPRWRQLVIQVGKGTDDFLRDSLDVIAFVGRTVSTAGYTLLHPSLLRPASISRQIAETGIYAVPIIGLMAVMISVVIGYQSVTQLRPYGAEDLTVDLVAVSMLREMGVLITAIMVAGRSGSAFTAEIGVMKSREEIDALQVMGLEPMTLLVLPRLIGLIITLPLLTFFSDIMGLLGGAMISQSLLHISFFQYLDRVREAVDTNDLLVGLIKAPVFAFFIATVSCMHGLRVRGSAESVGRETTRAVVKGIFLVIVFDALFSVLFEKIGI